MVRLIPIETGPQPFVPEPISDVEAAASFRAVSRLFARWEISDEDAAILLDMAIRTYRRWKVEGPKDIGRDARARLSNILGIHKALRIIFGNSERVYGWVKSPNSKFNGATALEVMLHGDLTDLMRVRRYLDAERGAW